MMYVAESTKKDQYRKKGDSVLAKKFITVID